MGPIDYSAAFGDGSSPLQAFNQALAGGSAIRANVLQQEQQQLQLNRQKQFQTDLQGLGANPTPQGIARLSVLYPEHAEQFKKSFDMLAPEQQKAKISAVIPVYAAIQSGRPDVAAAKLRETAKAMEASDQKDEAARTSAMADLIEQHPETGATTAGLLLASVMGPEKFAETFGKLGAESRAIAEAPADLAQKQALASKTGEEAKTAAVTSKYAESNALKDLEKKGWDIKALQGDIDFKKQSVRIAAMQAALAQKKDAREQQELQLKIDDALAKRETTVREKAAEATNAASTIDNMLNTIDRLKKNPGLRDVVGSIEGQKYYPNQVAATVNLLNPFVSSGDDRADAIAMIETIGSQAFLAQVPTMKGMGSLTEREGAKLESSLQSLSRAQSEKQFSANLDEAQRLMLKARKGIELRTGVKLATPDTPAVEPSPGEIDALVNKYLKPGAK